MLKSQGPSLTQSLRYTPTFICFCTLFWSVRRNIVLNFCSTMDEIIILLSFSQHDFRNLQSWNPNFYELFQWPSLTQSLKHTPTSICFCTLFWSVRHNIVLNFCATKDEIVMILTCSQHDFTNFTILKSEFLRIISVAFVNPVAETHTYVYMFLHIILVSPSLLYL